MAYNEFAYFYDEFNGEADYDALYAHIHKELTAHGIADGILADLGCGTGELTLMLTQAGYDMIGIDNSYEMLEVANEKKLDTGHESILYLMQDMREFELFGTVNAIVCVCDSINYLTELSDITHVFRLANNYLESKGIFICDFKTRHYFKDVVADSTIAEDRDDVSFIWDNYYDTETDINELALSLFLPEYPESGIEPDDECPLYRKYQEFHYQRGLTLDDMRTCVADSGMELVAMYDAFTWLPATDSSERVYVVARETHQDNKHYE